MFPYQWGSVSPMGYFGSGMVTGMLPVDYPGYRDLPEEVRAALEERQSEIRDERDLRRLVDELMLRR